ncbi:MAG: S8 family serine peptidase [Halobacteriaceae archaeon]
MILIAQSAAKINVTKIKAFNITVGSQHGRRIEITGTPPSLKRLLNLSWVESIRREISPTRPTTSDGVKTINADRLHELNVTGQGVKIGVITLGVDPDSSEYADQVAAAKAFHPQGIEGEDPTHGTAVTEIVSDTAPNASLYLTAFDTSVDYANAVEWLKDKNVDIIVMSISFLFGSDTGSSYVSQVAINATNASIVWVNSAGNAAQKHWQGTFSDPDEDGLLNFNSSKIEEGIYIDNGTVIEEGTRIWLTIKWLEFPSSNDDYTLILYNSSKEVIATSTDVGSDDYPVEFLQTTIPRDDTYFFAINGSDSPHLIEVFGSDNINPFQYFVRNGSILAPSVAEPVVAVGAYNVDSGDIAPYSSAGPTNDGRRGIDILGPAGVATQAYAGSFNGTSAAAPHIAGAAALLLAVNESLTNTALKSALMETAKDVGPAGTDIYAGAGKANVSAAAEIIDPIVNLTIIQNESIVTTDEWISYRVLRVDTNESINASITIANFSDVTGADGELDVQYKETGTYTVNASAIYNPPTADFANTSIETTVEKSAVSVKLTPTNSTIGVNSTTTFDVVVVNVTNGVGSYNVTITVENGSVATITDITFKENPGIETVTYGSNNDTVTIAASILNTTNTGNVTILSVTIVSETNGTTPITIDVHALGSESGESYPIATIENSTLIVQTGPPPVVGDQEPTDPDGDGKYEDINGDGEANVVDVQALFANLHSDVVQNNPKFFDFNDDGEVNVVDVQRLFVEV